MAKIRRVGGTVVRNAALRLEISGSNTQCDSFFFHFYTLRFHIFSKLSYNGNILYIVAFLQLLSCGTICDQDQSQIK